MNHGYGIDPNLPHTTRCAAEAADNTVSGSSLFLDGTAMAKL